MTARIALEEARELRPDAPELADAERRVALLPLALPVAPATAYIGSRTLNAFLMLFVGVALVTAIDVMRSDDSGAPTMAAASAEPPANVETVGADAARALDFTSLQPDPVEPDDAGVTIEGPESRADAIGTGGAFAAPPPPVPEPDPPVRERPVPLPVRERVVTPVVRPAVTLSDAGIASPPADEISDEFVATQPRRESIVASPLLPRASRGPLLIPPPAVETAPAARNPSPEPAAASPAIAPVRREETLVSSVLDRYARAYDALDASAAREVWPTVDERALARAFADLESQRVSLDDCSIDVRGETANASCRGLASYVGKVGNRQPRTEPRQWTFELRRDGDAWKIESARTQLVP